MSAAPTSVHAIQVNVRNPYVESWSLDAQQQIGRYVILDVGYYGNHAVHLAVTEDINAPPPGLYAQKGIIPGNTVTAGTTQLLNQIRPYLGYGPIDAQLQAFSSNYNGLQVSATRRLSGGSVLTVNYTYSRALSNATAPQNIYDPAAEYGPSAFNRTHNFNANFVYVLPFFRTEQGLTGHLLGGWEATGIVSYGSGLSLTPHTTNVDPGGLGLLATDSSEAGTARSDYLSNPNHAAPHSRPQWFNTNAFTQVSVGQYRPGNASNGSILGPGYGDWDLSLFKNVQIKNSLNMQLRAESFNAFNRTNFSGVATTLGLTNYGQVTSAGPARVLQLAAKIRF